MRNNTKERKTMRPWNDHFSCEVPHRAENRLFLSIREMLGFMRDSGAETITYDEDFDVWRCTDPEWIEGRDMYSAMMQRHCDRYGCE
tara:strand:- start:858 stop:1118 length:261 start_codon:yes stop_codon:yes gene_type:complete